MDYKDCTDCGEHLALTLANWYMRDGKPNGGKCKRCEMRRAAEYREAHKEERARKRREKYAEDKSQEALNAAATVIRIEEYDDTVADSERSQEIWQGANESAAAVSNVIPGVGTLVEFGQRTCRACKQSLPEDEKNFKLTGKRLSAICIKCMSGSASPGKAKRKRSKQSPEKTRKDQERRRRNYIAEFGPVPLCACGCGNEVKVPGKGCKLPKRLRGHGLSADSMKRQDFRDIVNSIKAERNLSHHDMAKLMGVDYNYYSATMYKKAEWISVETVARLMQPLLFLGDLTGDMIPKKSPGDGAKVRWGKAERFGYHRFAPLRDEFLQLKDELNSSYRKLGDFLGIQHAVLKNFWGDSKEYVSDENYWYWKKQMNLMRSLSPEAKRDRLHRGSHVNVRVVDRAPFSAYARHFKDLMGYATWAEMASALEMSADSLRGHVNNKRSKVMRKSIHDDLMSRMAEIAFERQKRINYVYGDLQRTHRPRVHNSEARAA